MATAPASAPSTHLTMLNPPSPGRPKPKYTIWFDIDNTLYSKHCQINEAMHAKISAYFLKLGLPEEEAEKLHAKYYKEYGLAIRGLVRHHQIDPLDYDQNCDCALPLEEILKPDPQLRQLLQDIDRSKARVWCITNAYKIHALRVLKIMGLSDQIEGVVSCDYTNLNFHCKPEPEFYEEALARASQVDGDASTHLLVDDSRLNIMGASSFGFGSAVFFDEDGSDDATATQKVPFERITKLDQLKNLPMWKECFRSNSKSVAPYKKIDMKVAEKNKVTAA